MYTPPSPFTNLFGVCKFNFVVVNAIQFSSCKLLISILYSHTVKPCLKLSEVDPSLMHVFPEQAKEHVLSEDHTIEEGFSTFEMRSSRRGTMKSQRGTMKSTSSRKSSNLAMINSSRNPPRPTPGMVNYSDEDSGKGYDDNPEDSDSLTEKPSEISSTDSQVSNWRVP